VFLQKVVDATRKRVERSKLTMPPAALEKICAGCGPLASFRESVSRLPGEEIKIIAEVKRRSPSRGPIRPDLILEDLVRAYEEGGACAVSVLTEPEFFGGSLDDISRTVKTADLPILRKDFIIDPYQLLEARAAGACAVLLIAATLDRTGLESMLAEAGRLGLGVLVEVHDEEELAAALEAGVHTLGINNRDLKTLRVDLGSTRRLAPLVPDAVVLVSESGYSQREQVVEAMAWGVHAILVGEALVREEDPRQALARLRGDGHGFA
jgi:indole-3-glycerol phosphate synthase